LLRGFRFQRKAIRASRFIVMESRFLQWLSELALRPDERSRMGRANAAVREGDEHACVVLGADQRIDGEGPVSKLVLAPGVYETTQGLSARQSLLARLHSALTNAGELVCYVTVSAEGALPGLLAIDWPRRALSQVGFKLAEPGARRDAQRFVREIDLLREFAQAGFKRSGRGWNRFVFEKTAPFELEPAPLRARDLVALANAFQWLRTCVETESPKALLSLCRASGLQKRVRTPAERESLAWAACLFDAACPGRRGCYRRTMLQVAVDGGAAREAVVFGLDVGRTGHAWLESEALAQKPFHVSFRIEPG
jgi:hypothetical protein